MIVIPLADVGLMSKLEAAAQLKVSVSSILNWIRAGQLPAALVSGPAKKVYLLRTADVQAFVVPRRGRPRSEVLVRVPGKPLGRRTKKKPVNGD